MPEHDMAPFEFDASDPVVRSRAMAVMDAVATHFKPDAVLAELISRPEVRSVIRYHTAVAIGMERERCARIAESEPVLPGSPWSALGFWKSLRYFWIRFTRPFFSARVTATLTRDTIAARIRARGES